VTMTIPCRLRPTHRRGAQLWGTQTSKLPTNEAKPYARCIDGINIRHVEDQNSSLRSPGLIAWVAPIVPVKLQTPQSFCAVSQLVGSTYVGGESRQTFQLCRISWVGNTINSCKNVGGASEVLMVRTEVQVLPNPYDQCPRRILQRFRIFTNRSPSVRPRNPPLTHEKVLLIKT